MTWRALTLVGLITIFGTVQAQEAPAEQRTPDSTAVNPQVPSRANNFHLPRTIRYNDEFVTEGFWVIALCGRPVMVIYDTDTQMSLPLFGEPLVAVARMQPWNLEDSPDLLAIPDLAQLYPPVAAICEDLMRAQKSIQERDERENETVTPPPTMMK